jgi:hypothetical protein
MKAMYQSNKKGLSELIGYVLLITLAISLSVLVYAVVTSLVPKELPKCDSNLNIIVSDYDCISKTTNGGNIGHLNVTIKNKGLFNLSGFKLKAHTRPEANLGFYVLNISNIDSVAFTGKADEGIMLSPNEERKLTYPLRHNAENFENISFFEIQPFLKTDKGIILCEGWAKVKVNRCI